LLSTASTRNHDASDLLDSVTNTYGTQTQSFGVTDFDNMNRRKKIAREDNTRWYYGYNTKGEVTTGHREKTAAPNTPVPGWNHAYTFDEIGNRLTTTTNGRAATYTPNALNQYENRTIPRAYDVIGKADAAASVTVDGNPATRLDEYFYKELTAGSGAVHVPYTVQATDASGTTTRNGGKFLQATPENYAHDDDGNLTSDGRFTYTWDAENRLAAMQTHANIPLPARRKLAYAYDSMGRRINKTVWHGTGSGSWQLHHKFDFIHELNGWNILAERSGGSTNNFLRTYTWGTDVAGASGSGSSLQGAGGVGGLLFATLHTRNLTLAYGNDLNGNVTLLVDTTSGQSAATYDYGPFGEPLRHSGEYALLNPYRFSTKYTDDETGLLDYGLRYYNPNTGRWPNHDPIGERGGCNLYGFVANDPLNLIDLLGNKIITNEEESYRNNVKESLQKVAGGTLKWVCEEMKGLNINNFDESNTWVLTVVEAGSGVLWDDLNKGFGKNPVIVLRQGVVTNNAGGAVSGDPREVFFNENVNILIPLATGNNDSEGDPIYEMKRQTFETVLWHELVGHSILERKHPKQRWNTYEFKKTQKKTPKWIAGDPTIAVENMARSKLNQPKRRPQYWDTKDDWYK
jgi:RHS repeat-associated protein